MEVRIVLRMIVRLVLKMVARVVLRLVMRIFLRLVVSMVEVVKCGLNWQISKKETIIA